MADKLPGNVAHDITTPTETRRPSTDDHETRIKSVSLFEEFGDNVAVAHADVAGHVLVMS